MILQNCDWLSPSAERMAFNFSAISIDVVPSCDLVFAQLVPKSELVERVSELPILAATGRNKRLAPMRRLAQMVMKLEGLGEGFCCRYALRGSLKGWLLRGRDMQSVIFIESPDSDEFIQALTKATSDLQDRLGFEKQFMSNADKAMSNTEKEDTPRIFAGSLSDEELISFLEDVIVKLMSRKNLTGKPESLREQAGEAEGKLKSTNDYINSIVYRQVRNPNLNP